ncbi:MAG: hypothetical protein V4864_13130 [Pseudomonadota bacterium]
MTSIPSIPYLEALLILKARPAQPWDAAQLARRLYVSDAAAAGLLAELQAAGVAAGGPEAGWRYAASPDLAAMLDQVEHCYAAHLVEMTALIHDKLDKRARQFADAFRWKK